MTQLITVSDHIEEMKSGSLTQGSSRIPAETAVGVNHHDIYAWLVDADKRCDLGVRIEISVIIHAPDNHYPSVFCRKERGIRREIFDIFQSAFFSVGRVSSIGFVRIFIRTSAFATIWKLWATISRILEAMEFVLPSLISGPITASAVMSRIVRTGAIMIDDDLNSQAYDHGWIQP